MKIKEITYQNRRDFKAIYICEGCGAEVDERGYDDAYFHQNVIPNMKCPKCGKTSSELGVDYRPLATKYPEGYQI
ncbi:MAG: hypothetical protein RR365_08615 [Bacteroides sp.]